MSHQSDLISTDIHAYLAQHERKELLRFLTCGNVDDGKSTLIGRLLHDSKMIYEDHLAAIQKDSVKSGTTGDDIDLALLVDGLQAEREQGITIDVAYRYFSTAQRKFIIADTPGHEQYTRNMATGASTCDLAIILIDARHGVQTQTRRHSFIVSLLGIKHVVVAINKMDLLGFSRETYETIRADYLAFADKLALRDIHFIPMSALRGDNVVNRSEAMPWFDGLPLMELLNTIEIADDQNFDDLRFPVQWVNRPNLDFRGFSGTVASGIVRRGDTVMALPSRRTSKVKAIVTYDGDQAEAFPPQAVTLTLEDEIDVSRGDMLVRPDNLPHLGSRFEAHIVWMTENPLIPGRQYTIKQTTRCVSGSIPRIHYRIDVNTLAHHAADRLALNEIGRCEIALSAPIAYDAYTRCKTTGSFIVIDRLTNATVGAGMILGPAESDGAVRHVSAEERAARFGQRAVTLWLTGDNRREVAYALERQLFDRGHAAAVIDEDGRDIPAALLARSLNHAGLVCLAAVADVPPVDAGSLVLPADEVDVEKVIELLDPLAGKQDFTI
ncbi:sulfate adenylyltransferase subunit CysN [Methylococcus sp. EFPC2]|uniref:sulfate adenylyltransferase subunit CysN n=1 Tax=Methylococcus sp. EFPC2 TaxID=2812648 RepID=UPI0019685D1A|nr:sulfate adenylyltransferase subunit CysN [Methylococcus sp. EFPC2]QSA97560.1 sulfate adenylyltransferase subunit CysN [Methylococcus sp. EFPC2]